MAYTKVMAKFGDQFLAKLVDGIPQSAAFFETLLYCFSYSKNLDIPEQTFYFWFELEDLVDNKNELKETIASAAVVEYVHALFKRILAILLSHLRYPSDQILQGWMKDEKDAFRNHRTECADTALYCYYNLQESALGLVMESLNHEISLVNSNSCGTQGIEACLHVVKAFSETVSTEENQYIPILFSSDTVQFINSLIERKVDGYVQLRITLASLFGAYGDWLSEREHLLSPVLDFLLSELQNSPHPSAAANALTDLSSVCQTPLSKHCDAVLTMCFSALGRCPPILQGKIIQSMMAVIQPLGGQECISRSLYVLNGIIEQFYIDIQNSNAGINTRPDVILHLEFLKSFAKGTRNRVVELEKNAITPEEIEAGGRVLIIFQEIGQIACADNEIAMVLTETIREITKCDIGALQCIFPDIHLLCVEWFSRTGNAEYIVCCTAVLKFCPKTLRESRCQNFETAFDRLFGVILQFQNDPEVLAECFEFLSQVYYF
jgi:DNA-binding NarL/FixJ family response regulator